MTLYNLELENLFQMQIANSKQDLIALMFLPNNKRKLLVPEKMKNQLGDKNYYEKNHIAKMSEK